MAHPLLDAVGSVADAVGATVVGRDEVAPGDIDLRWRGELVGGFRLGDVAHGLDWHMAAVEREFGGPLADLPREDKQRVVKLLNERGAFQLRKSVEQVAEALAVSRFTVYNYLNRPEAQG